MPDLDAEWEELADRIEAPPFLRPGWFAAWRQAFGDGELLTIEVRRGDELVGIAPLLRDGGRLASRTSWHSPYFATLALDDGARAEVYRQVFSRPETVVDLNLLSLENSGGIEALERGSRAAGRVSVVRTPNLSSYVGIPGTFDEYLKENLSGDRRRSMRRKRRRLEEQGEVTFTVHDGSTDLDQMLRQFYDIENSGWKRERGEAISSSPDLERFYTDLAHWAARRGWLRLACVRLDGEPIAIQYALEHGSRWYLIRMGYDETYRKFGPGAVLMHEEVRHCAEVPTVTRIDLLGGHEEFKAAWATGEEPRYWVLAYRRTPKGLARYAEAKGRQTIGPRLREWRNRRAAEPRDAPPVS